MRPFLMMVSGVVHTLWLVASLIWCIPILNVFLMWLCMHKQAPYLCAGLLCIFAYPSAYIRTFMYLCISVPLTCIYTLRPMYFCISVPLAWICIIRSMYFCISVPLACIYIIRPMYLCISVYHRHVYILYVEWVEYSWPTVPQCQGLAASGSCFDPRLCMFMRTSLIHDQCNWRCHTFTNDVMPCQHKILPYHCYIHGICVTFPVWGKPQYGSRPDLCLASCRPHNFMAIRFLTGWVHKTQANSTSGENIILFHS